MDTASYPSSEAVSIGNDTSAQLILFSHELPTDDVQELFRNLRRHSKKRQFPLLAAFLGECTDVLKGEVGKLPQQQRDAIPQFLSVTDLVISFNELRKTPSGGAWEGSFLCIYQIAMLIGYHEARGLDFDAPLRETTLAGMSIGLFAAAATAASSSLLDLVNRGAESVRVSFAFCAHVGWTSNLLESPAPEEPLLSWAYVVTGVSAEAVQTELDAYNHESNNSDITKVRISHIDKSSVGVTGTPARLQTLFQRSGMLRSSKHSSLPIHGGLCHVPSVYDSNDVASILKAAQVENWGSRSLKLPLLSPFTGLPFPAVSFGHLIELICTEALTTPLFFDKLTEGIFTRLSGPELLQYRILQFRTSIISNNLLSTVAQSLPSVTICRQDMVEWASMDYDGPARSAKDSKLAIVGMACRLPGGANDPELFWELIVNGRDVHTTIPPDRFDLDAHYDPTGKTDNTTSTPFGNFVDGPGLFDATFFNMSPREAEQTCPMQRLALVTAYEALEMAGFVPSRSHSTHVNRVGTFYGQASDDYREVNANQNVSTYGIPGTERAFGNGRINYFFNFGGPSFNLDTACSSGLAAVNAACSSLWAGETDLAIAGGLNIITNPDIYCMLTKGHFLSKTGQCKVWDKDADGYCRADGVGSIVIKRLDDAVADNDTILATIVSGATNHSAEAISITHPHASSQRNNYRQVMAAAGINPLDVSYIELHGTGTQAGDAVESESVGDIFAPITPRRDQRLHLGAVKSNIGHGEAAAGIASLIKVLLMYQKNIIPRHVGIKSTTNPVVVHNMEKRNAGLVMENTPWPKPPGKKRYSIVNSFGAHGGNTTLLLEDAPERTSLTVDPRNAYVVAISAKTKFSLRGNIESLIRYLDENKDKNFQLGDLSYTMCARRIHYAVRIAASVTTPDQLRQFLVSSLDNSAAWDHARAKTPNIAFAFSGQGGHYAGAGAQLFEAFPPFRDLILQFDRTVRQLGFPSVISVIANNDGDIRSPIVSQLSIVILQLALARFWELLGVKPNVVIGHSLGEYAALVVAGVLSVADAIFLVGKRAELLMERCTANTHSMLSVRATAADVASHSGGHGCEVSCLNGRADTVISGPREEIQTVRNLLEANGFKCHQLEIPFAFHSAQLDPILDSFEQIAKYVTFKPPSVPVISPLLGQCIFDGKTLNELYLRRASREPVNFISALDAAASVKAIDERTVWLEIGPRPVCTAFVRNHIPDTVTFSSLHRKEDNITTIANTIASLFCKSVPICWNEYFRPYEKAHTLLHLKNYHWNTKNYWIQYSGNWTLEKAHAKNSTKPPFGLTPNRGISSFRSSSVQHIVSEDIQGSIGKMTAISDIRHDEFLDTVKGHTLNKLGVVTRSIWADIAFTIGEYLYKRMDTSAKVVPMNVSKMEVLEAQIVRGDPAKSQLLQIEAEIDLSTKASIIRWYTIRDDGNRSEHSFASACVLYENTATWTTEWRRMTHLLQDRIKTLSQMATEGIANKLSRNMIYNLFKNVVDYADRYRGMQSVVLNGYEAFTDIELDPERHGTWHTPPHWIDSVFQLAGFIMNGSDASNTRDFFCITPGWSDLRIIKPLESGIKYRSYVRMFEDETEPGTFVGDIYTLQEDAIIGMCGNIKFKRVPRMLMNRLFNSAESQTPAKRTQTSKPLGEKPQMRQQPSSETSVTGLSLPKAVSDHVVAVPVAPTMLEAATQIRHNDLEAPEHLENGSSTVIALPGAEENSVVSGCLKLIARETGLDVSQLADDASFSELGIDSLMSLVLSEKFQAELDIEVKSSIFLECVTVQELTDWLKQYY